MSYLDHRFFVAFSCDLEFSPEIRRKGNYQNDLRLISGLDRLLKLLDKTNTFCTFFTQGLVCEKLPDIVKNIFSLGYEIGSHGFSHIPLGPIWPLGHSKIPQEKVRREIIQSMEVINQLIGKFPISFRAPYLRLGKFAFKTLEENGFLFDSSLYNPAVNRSSNPYHPAFENPACEGELKFWEVPVSVSSYPKNKIIYSRHPVLFELSELKLINELRDLIESARERVLLVPFVHPYDLCSEEFFNKVSIFIETIRKADFRSVLFSQLRETLDLE
jgi:peptidoglycan/xylan/chitin deacetylase (PgdA/CDA1 family)